MNKERYTMKNFKKLAAFALAATMSLGLLTACGGHH